MKKKEEEMKNKEVSMKEPKSKKEEQSTEIKEEKGKKESKKEIKEEDNKKEQEVKIEEKKSKNEEEVKNKKASTKEKKNEKSNKAEQATVIKEPKRDVKEKKDKVEQATETKEEKDKKEQKTSINEKKSKEDKEQETKVKDKKNEEKPKKEIKDKNDKEKQKEVKQGVKKVKDENKKKKDNKIKNKKSSGKKITVAIISIISVIAISCVIYFLTLNIFKASAINEIDNAFTALKSGDEEIIKKYLATEAVKEMSEDLNDEDSRKMAKVMLSHLEYEVVSADVNFKEGEIKINVSNKDLKKVFENYMKKVFSIAISQTFGKMSDEDFNSELLKILQEQYDSESIETIKNELVIKLTRENGEWKIDSDADENQIVNAILPGYESVLESLKDE